jgi:predicted phage gp36 major capsid-like protein
MARAIIGGQVAVSTTARSVSTILSLSPGRDLRKLTIKNAGASANKVYLGDSDVSTTANAHVELSADQGYEYWSSESHRVNTDDVFIVGVAGAANIVYINGVF